MTGRGDQLSERLFDFVVRVVTTVDMLPKTVSGKHIGNQLMSAGTSCGANYEEACGAESRSDFIHKMGIVLKELRETRFWLRLIHKTELLSPQLIQPLIEECEQLCAIVGKSIVTAKTNRKKSTGCA
jgi:four helix bundle protein